MEYLMQAWGWYQANGAVAIGSAVAVLGGLLGIAMLIPGNSPDKELQWALDMLKKLSVKKK